MQRPEVQAATVQTPVPPPSRTAQNKRVSQLSWVIGLMLIVGAAAGSWYYVAPATETSQASVDVESADTSAQPDQADATTTVDDAERDAPEPESGSTITQAESLVANGTAEPTPNIEPPEPTQPQPTQPAVTSFATTQTVTTQPAVAQPTVVQPEAVKPAAPSGPPKFVVIARGDPAVSGVVESVLENALLAADFPVMDEQFFDGLNLNAFNPSLASIGRTVLDNGGSILVYADIRETGQRELKFYGRSERQTLANLQVQVVSLRDKRNVGAPWMAPMEYVPLNATDTAREVSEPIAQDLVARLQSLQQ